MKQLKNVNHVRAYIRPLFDMTLEQQLRAIEKAAPNAVLYIEGEMEDARSSWLRALRSDEMALLPRLDVLAIIGRKGRDRPSSDFTTTLAILGDKANCIADAHHNITSLDKKRWYELIAWAMDKVASGRSLPKKRAKKMAKKSWENRAPGPVKYWTSDLMRKERARWKQHWLDPRFPNQQAAFDAMPDDIQESIGSKSSARRIFKDEHD